MASYQTSTAGPSRPTYPAYPSQPPSISPVPSPLMEQEHWTSNGQYGNMQMPQPRSLSGSTSGSASVSRSASGASVHGTGNPSATRDDGGEGSKRNPLVDLIDSEKFYVEQLSLVIRKVAAAWSRKDFPPPKLDAMFRCVEAVYRANRAFGSKLKEIGPNPSSPKALGDLLMRWIDDLEPAYHKYCTTFLAGFDSYQPVTRNQLLAGILNEISASCSPTPPLNQWSLDALFILPYTRLRYYRKLYARLLRSTKEGRSDHKLLVVANQRLEGLVGQVESRLEMDVSENDLSPSDDNRTSGNGSSAGTNPNSRQQSWSEKERISRTSSAMDSSMESHTNRIEDRNSGGSAVTNMTSITQSPQRRPHIQVSTTSGSNNLSTSSPTPTSASAPLSDLELRIDSERTIDLFSMTPKKCKLQMNPPTLPFTRSLRSSHDVTVYFTPNSTGQLVTHRRAHIFILSDLFLVAEWMEASEKAAKAQQVAREQPERVGHGGPMPEMWLSYPPLAGKHLMVAEGEQANVLTIMIMKKETFTIHAESDIARDQIMKDLIDCIDFASGVTRPSTAAPSPINPDPRSPSVTSIENRSNESVFPPLRYPSPFSNSSSPSTSPRPNDQPDMPPMPLGGNALLSQMNQISLQPGEAIAWPRGPTPPQPQAMPQPPYNAAPAPGAPAMAVLPPRGASLRSRVQSNNMQSPPQQHAPQIPPMPGMAFDRSSDPQLMPGSGAPLPRSPSGRSVQSAPRMNMNNDLPPVPPIGIGRSGPGGSFSSDQGHPQMPVAPFAQGNHMIARSRSLEPLRAPEPPSARFSSFETAPGAGPGLGGIGRSSPLTSDQVDQDGHGQGDDEDEDDIPPEEEQEEITSLTGPTIISAQMKCKVFLKQEHQKWKSLGGGKLKLYVQKTGPPLKQLVVENDSSKSQMIISTIVLTDGVERVAKTGVAVEISDKGKRTGIVYMIQLRNEKSAMGLFESLLQGSDRAVNR
ncbi:uncharacterized protein I303_101748 [Kwoniella dejecticola CBS 10117]|uniref:DH domain-containing protein n=1 Tax=Kwoniella dejecticola CBS 10117 TaxID=1296121 RepID=A0A1A6ACV5_9TREE|nr:uncharacterized protein I303_02116 [Kwoniella dejecticola CBS 10117]OBR87902.1 hypothetical protein I303_02116 [Kwoniella dejecticola CBS 10117]